MQRQPTCVCVNLRRLARATTALYDQALAASGLKITQYSLLCAVERAQPIAISVLAAELELDRTTLARNLDPLQRDGLIALEVAQDKRVTLVTLSARGRAALAKARPAWKKVQAQIAQKIGAPRVAMLRALAAEFGALED